MIRHGPAGRLLQSLLIAALCVAISAALTADLLYGLLIGVLLTLCGMPWLLWHRVPDLTAPVYFTVVMLTLLYPIRALHLLAFPDYTVGVRPPPYDDAVVVQALGYAITGIVAYLVGFYAGGKSITPPSPGGRDRSRLRGWPGRILLLYSLGWFVRLYQIGQGNYRTFLLGEAYDITTFTLLVYLAELAEIAYVLAWVNAFWGGGSRSGWALAIAVTGVEAGYALAISGAKIAIIRLAVFVVLARYLASRHAPLRGAVIVAAVVIFFAFPYVQAYRTVYLEKSPHRPEISLELGAMTAIEAMARMYSQPGHYSAGLTGDEPAWLAAAVIFLNRWHGFDSVIAVMEQVPHNVDYAYGSHLLTAPFALMPRALWPDKPLSEVVEVFERRVMFNMGDGSTSPYPITEGYFNGGLLGVIGVMLTLALIQRLVYAMLAEKRWTEPLAAASYIWLLIWVGEVGTWILPIFAHLPQRLVILCFVWLLFARSKTGAEALAGRVGALPVEKMRAKSG